VGAAVALLYPFEWQHVLVPILPKKLLDMACAPIPFLLGILEPCMATVRQMPIEDAIYIDLDGGSVTAACISPNSQRARVAKLSEVQHVRLPDTHAGELRNALENIEKTAVHIDSQGVMLAFFQV
jgi:hypothetical protein